MEKENSQKVKGKSDFIQQIQDFVDTLDISLETEDRGYILIAVDKIDETDDDMTLKLICNVVGTNHTITEMLRGSMNVSTKFKMCMTLALLKSLGRG